MSDFDGLLTSDYGYKPQGKSAPMSARRPPSNTTSRSFNFDLGPDSVFSFGGVQKPQNGGDFDDLFGAPSKRKDEAVDFDSVFGQGSKPPVYDKPVYDDDVFESVPGIKSFSSSSSGSSAFDDLLGGFGEGNNNLPKSKDSSKDEFDDLIPGFGGSSTATERLTPRPTWSSDPVATSKQPMEDPFADLASVSPHLNSSFAVPSDPLENFNNPSKSDEGAKADEPSVSSGVYDDLDPFDGFPKPVAASSSDTSSSRKDRSSVQTDRGNINGEEQVDQISPRVHGSHSNKPSVDNDLESHQSFFDMPSASNRFSEPADHSPSAPYETYSTKASIPVQEKSVESSDEVWLSVSEIPLFTRPTSAPPPARPPPPRPTRASKVGSGHGFEVPKSAHEGGSATLEELEAFVMGRSTEYSGDTLANGFSSEAVGPNPDAAASEAAMNEAMDRAEAKFRHGKEVRERESTRATRSRESVQQESDESWLDAEERALKEKQELLQKQREEEEKERIRREKEREREEKEREQRRLDRAREERERARQAVERATREARERAAAEARAKAERAAVSKANAEARERAERAAVLRAQAEARERAAAEAKERAERAAAEAREREARERATEARMKAERAEKEAAEAREKEAREKAAEARRRAERAAVERAAAEARQRAAAEARDRAAAAAARANQQKNDNDLESFFSVPRPKTNPTESSFDSQFQSKKGPEVSRTSDAAASSVRKASPKANFVDDFSSIFGVAPSTSGDFQEIKGETEERRRARLERQQRTQERAAKALAEKNHRDLQAQREQDERHRIGESLDVEIKRWSAGKEGNLRALLSTLQYVLWPECGWQPVSLTDLITGANVKKAYRRATLCIHPDKVQQKGANLQQKYIAEKVFDLLKEAWNKFNSEELF